MKVSDRHTCESITALPIRENVLFLLCVDCLDELSCKRITSLTGHCSKLLYFNEKLLSAVGENIMNNIYMWNIWQVRQDEQEHDQLPNILCVGNCISFIEDNCLTNSSS